MTVEVDFNLRSTETQFNSFTPSGKQEEAREKFEEVFGNRAGGTEGDINSGVNGPINITAIVFNWENWISANNLHFEREGFTENPTGVTTRWDDEDVNRTPVFIFSDGENSSYFSKDYVEDAEEVLGYSLASNLDKLYMPDEENAPLVAEGDEFDIIIANRIPPEDQ